MNLFFVTSALVKFFHEEEGSENDPIFDLDEILSDQKKTEEGKDTRHVSSTGSINWCKDTIYIFITRKIPIHQEVLEKGGLS